MAKQSIPPDLAWRLLEQIVGVKMLRTVIGTFGSGRASNKGAVAWAAGATRSRRRMAKQLFAQRKADCFMLRSSGVIAILLGAAPMGWAQQAVQVGTAGTFVPAGTLLHCTLDEPNFSSKTAQVGDPVLCHVNSVEMFGRPLIPRGAYLSARLEEYRDPGHFWGKGWIQLEFTSLTLPNGNFPLSAKVIAARHYRVDREGKILGRGHPKRDLVEWSIPILWPIKVLTLPARGPYPTLKGETRIDLRLMEDVLISESTNSTSSGLRSSASSPGTDDRSASLATSRFGSVFPSNRSLPEPQPVPSAPIWYRTTPANLAQPTAPRTHVPGRRLLGRQRKPGLHDRRG